MQLVKNAIVAGRFRLNHLIGRGGMGSVWHATHMGLDVPCAIKFIEGERANRPESATRFEREAKAAAQLRGRNVVQILDHGICDGTPYIAMELLEGEDLGKRLERVKRLPAQQVVAIVGDVARALRKAHAAGIVHRDLKPENIFLVQDDDDREITKVLDFGIAKVTTSEPSARTRTGELLGTPHYMSPEQAQGNREIDWRSDLWSLAVITFECLTGVRPFESDGLGDLLLKIFTAPVPVPSTIADLPRSFDMWWKRAIARDPAGRFQSANAFAESLAIALAVDLDASRAGYAGVNSSQGARLSDTDVMTPRGARATAPTSDADAVRDDSRKTDPAPPDYASTDRLTTPYADTALAMDAISSGPTTPRSEHAEPAPAPARAAKVDEKGAPARRVGVTEMRSAPQGASPAESRKARALASGENVAQGRDFKTTDRDRVIDRGQSAPSSERSGNTNDGAEMDKKPPMQRPSALLFVVIFASGLLIWTVRLPLPSPISHSSSVASSTPSSTDALQATGEKATPTSPSAGSETPVNGGTASGTLPTTSSGGSQSRSGRTTMQQITPSEITIKVDRAEHIDKVAVDAAVNQASLIDCSTELPSLERSRTNVVGTLSFSIDRSGQVKLIDVTIKDVAADEFGKCVVNRLTRQHLRFDGDADTGQAILGLTLRPRR